MPCVGGYKVKHRRCALCGNGFDEDGNMLIWEQGSSDAHVLGDLEKANWTVCGGGFKEESYRCLNCGVHFDKDGNALTWYQGTGEHRFSEVITDELPSDCARGSKIPYKYCLDCGAWYKADGSNYNFDTDYQEGGNHRFSEVISDELPSDCASGSKIPFIYCLDCGAWYRADGSDYNFDTDFQEGGNHRFSEVITDELEFECSSGSKIPYKYCLDCGAWYKADGSDYNFDTDYQEGTNHKFGALQPADVNECGYGMKVPFKICEVCGFRAREDGTGIDWDTDSSLGTKHSFVEAPAEENPATCIGGVIVPYKYCTVCWHQFRMDGNDFEDSDVLVGDWKHNMVWIPEKPATYTENGCKGHYECTLCGNAWKDEVGASWDDFLDLSTIVIPKLDSVAVVEEVTDKLDEVLSSSDSAAAVEALTQETSIAEIQVAMQESEAVVEKVKVLEEKFAEQKNVEVTKSVAPEAAKIVEAEKVTMVGAAFSAKENSSVRLDVSVPEKEVAVSDTAYANTVQLEIKLVNDEEKVTQLVMPITITMPIPAGIDPSMISILHYGEDGSVEEITPKVNVDGTITFTITHFSTFVFAEKKSAPAAPVSSGNSGNSGAWADKAVNAIKSASEGSVVKIDKSSGLNTLTLDMLQNLRDKKVSLQFEYTYNGVDHTIFIPADKVILVEGVYYYGPLFLLSLYGEMNPASASAGADSYKVVPGDSLSRIAYRNGTTVAKLLALNPQIKNADLIRVGQKIRLN